LPTGTASVLNQIDVARQQLAILIYVQHRIITTSSKRTPIQNQKKLVAFGPKVTKCMPTDNIFSRHAVYRNPRASNPKESSLLVRIFLYLIA